MRIRSATVKLSIVLIRQHRKRFNDIPKFLSNAILNGKSLFVLYIDATKKSKVVKTPQSDTRRIPVPVASSTPTGVSCKVGQCSLSTHTAGDDIMTFITLLLL